MALVLLLGLAGAGIALLSGETGRERLARLLAHGLSAVSGYQVVMEGLGPGLPWRLRLDRLTLADDQGIFLSAAAIDLALDPQPLLTSAALVITQLAIGEVQLERLPEEEPAAVDDAGGFSLPRLPLVRRLDLPDVALGEPVLGEAIRLRAEGGISALDGEQRISLSVARLDEGSGDALSLIADGAGADWRGELAAQAATVGRFRFTFAAAGEKETRLSLEGGGELAESLLPLPFALGEITAEAALRLAADGVVHVDRLALAASDARLDAHGALDPKGDGVALTFAAEIPGSWLPPLTEDGFAAASATVAGELSGRLSAPAAEVTITLAEAEVAGALTARQMAAVLHLAPPTSGDGYEARLDLTTDGVRYEMPGLGEMLGGAPTLTVTLRADAALATFTDVAATLTGSAGRVALSDGRLDDSGWQAKVAAGLDRLDVFRDMAGFPLTGRLLLDADAGGSLDDGSVAARLQLDGEAIAIGEPVLQSVLGPRPRLQANLRRDGEGRVAVDDLHLVGQHGEASGSGRFDEAADALSARLALRLPRLAPVLAAAGTTGGGAAMLDAAFAGTASDPDLRLSLVLDKAEIAGIAVPTARAEIGLVQVASAPAGTASLLASTPWGPLTAGTRLAVTAADVLQLSEVSVAIPAASLTGGLAISLTDGAISGALSGRLTAEPTPLAIADGALGGRADLALTLSEDRGAQGLTLVLTGRALSFTAADGAPLAVQRLDARMAGRLAAGEERIDLTLSAEQPAGREGQAAIAGTLTRAGAAWQVDVNTLSADLDGSRLALAKPLNARFGDDEVVVSPFALTVNGGRLEGGGRWRADGTLDARVNGSRLPLSLLRLAAPDAPGLDGTADLSLLARNVGDRLAANLEAAVSVTHGDGKPARPALSLRAQGRLVGGELGLTVKAEGPGGSVLDAALSAPLSVSSRDFAFDAAGDTPLRGSVRGRAELAPLTAALGLDGQSVAGTLNADLALAGSLLTPRLVGEANVDELRYENYLTGTILDRGRIVARLDGEGAVVLTLDARDGGNGRIDGDGELRVGGEEALAAVLRVRAVDARLVRRDDVTATVNGEVRYRGSATSGLLSGELTVTPAEIWLIGGLPPSVVVLDVIEVGRDRPAPPAAPVDPGWQGTLNIAVDMPRRIFVRGRGLEAEWSGALKITGKADEPRVEGRLQLVRGHYDFAGKRFVLTRGIITLYGSNGSDVAVDIAAERRTPTITAVISAAGPADRPEIRLSADRDLPESEILSQVLFGKSSTRLGPVEAVQLATAVQALSSGRGLGDDAFSFVRTMLGLDTLTIGTDEETGTPTVGAGRYIGERVYIGGVQGVEPGTTAGTVSIEIAPGILLESQVQTGEEEAVGTFGLRWKWDY